MQLLAFVTAFFAVLSANVSAATLSGTSNVNLNVNTGNVMHYGSGMLMGVTPNWQQIPAHWYKDIGMWNQRTGGAQLGEPARGWTYGETEFQVCMNVNAILHPLTANPR